MSLNKYQIFSTVVKTGSLTRAAEALHITQSAVSHAIAGLESEMGFLLLNRNRNGITLTKNGEIILKNVQEVLQCNERLEQRAAMIKGFEIGTVNVGTFMSVSTQWLPFIFDEFYKSYPKIQINLCEGNYDDLAENLESRMIDVTFISEAVAENFETIHLKDDEWFCIMPRNHALAAKDCVRIDDLRDEQFIFPKNGKVTDAFTFLKDAGFTPHIRYSMTDDNAVMSFVQKGFGISFLPRMVLYRRPDDIEVRPIEGSPKRSICLAAHSFKELSPSAKKFVNTTVEWIESQP